MNVTTLRNGYLRQYEVSKESEETDLLVANALRLVIENVFINQSNTFIFTISTAGYAVDAIIEKLLTLTGFIAVQLILLNNNVKYSAEALSGRCCHIIIIDSLKSLVETNIVQYNQNSDSLEYYFIFLKAHDTKINREMELILRYCYDNYWLNCNVMVQSSKGEILIYSYFPFKANNCFQTEPVLINQFKKDRFINSEIFPNKLEDLQGCAFKISTWHTPPFVADYTNKRFPGLNVTGFEMITLTEISRLMNFSLAIEWISFNRNQSPEAVLLEKLKSHETNISLGIFRRTTHRDKIATPVYPTYSAPIIPLILRKGVSAVSIGIFTFPFDYITWTLIIVFYLMMVIINVLKTKDIKTSIFNTFEIIIGSSTNKVPQKSSTRVRFMTTIISSLILRTFYQSLLFLIFRSHIYLVPPYSLIGLAKEGYRAVATKVTAQVLLQVPEIANNTLPLIITNSSSEMSPMRFMEFHRNESLVAMSTNEFAMRYVHEELTFRTAIRVLPFDIKEQQISFYLPKHSYLIDCFNHYVLRLHASGLLKIWQLWSTSQYKVIERTVPHSGYYGNLVINLQQIGGFFQLMCILHSISILFFILEILSSKYKWLQKFL